MHMYPAIIGSSAGTPFRTEVPFVPRRYESRRPVRLIVGKLRSSVILNIIFLEPRTRRLV